MPYALLGSRDIVMTKTSQGAHSYWDKHTFVQIVGTQCKNRTFSLILPDLFVICFRIYTSVYLMLQKERNQRE